MLKNLFHKCKFELVALNDEYHTQYTDTGNKKYHQMRFYRCSCGKRSFKTDYDSKYSKHSGLEQAKQNWLDTGVVPGKSYHPETSNYYVKIDDLAREKLDPILAYQKTLEDIQKSLKVIINRDFVLEDKYPELKKAADEYHRRLDKYRTFESLKEKQ